MKVVGFGGVILTAVLLGACAAAPGMKMTEPAEIERGVSVRVQPITFDLINRLDEERESRVRKVAEEFAVRPQGYVIGPGDVIQVIVWGHPELTIPAGQFRDAETSGQLISEDGPRW